MDGASIIQGLPAVVSLLHVNRQDHGTPPPFAGGEISLSLARGIAPRAALLGAKPPIAVPHVPGRRAVPDIGRGEPIRISARMW